MRFSEFLLIETSVMFSFWNDGRIIAWIDGKKYVYATDAIHHDRWRKQSKRQPLKVLSQIKNYVERGWAIQLEPDPKST